MTLTKKGRQILQTLIIARNAVNHTHPYVYRKMVPMHPLLAQILTTCCYFTSFGCIGSMVKGIKDFLVT